MLSFASRGNRGLAHQLNCDCITYCNFTTKYTHVVARHFQLKLSGFCLLVWAVNFISQISNRSTSNMTDKTRWWLTIPIHPTVKYTRFFEVSACHYWNEPENIESINTRPRFGVDVKSSLIPVLGEWRLVVRWFGGSGKWQYPIRVWKWWMNV